MIKCNLSPAKTQTAYGPLCALGHYLRQNRVLQPLEWVHLPQKTIRHSPTEKLLDALIGILASCSALSPTSSTPEEVSFLCWILPKGEHREGEGMDLDLGRLL